MATTNREPRRCPRCGARVAQQARSCLLCGQELRSPSYLQPALALVAVAIVAGAVVAGLRDRAGGAEPPSGALNAAPGKPSAVAMAALSPPAEEAAQQAVDAVSPSPGTVRLVTSTPVPPSPTATPVPTETHTPTPEPVYTATPTPGPRVHVVQSGDVLGSIALQYDLEVEDVLAANPGLTERSILRVGQQIVIPAGSAPGEAPDEEPSPAAPEPLVHTVESGDNLLYLATKYDTTVSDILAVNPGLTRNSILSLGQKIVIPTPASEAASAAPTPEPTATPEPQFIEHSIERGDTLGYLASQYGTTLEEILAANPGLTKYTILSVGQKVRVPVPPQAGGPEPTPTPAVATEAAPTAGATALAAGPTATASLLSLGGPAQPRALEPLSPRGGARVLPRELILMWTGVGDLAPDLWYVVHVWRVGEPSDTLTGWTRASSWRPTEDLAARWGTGAHLFWDVGIGREIAVAGAGQPRFESAGPRTEPQDFYLGAD